MSYAVLERFISQYLNLFSGRLMFIWHGGEPLLAGRSFFNRVLELQDKYMRDGQEIRNTIQTNATLINEKWASFFKENGFGVGVSVDGARESHDRFRINRKGGGTLDSVMRGINILRDNGVKPGLIQTITSQNARRVGENLEFFVGALGVNAWGINAYLDVGGVNQAMLDQSLSNEELESLLVSCIDFWLEQDRSELRIREIENFMSGVLGRRAPNCTFNGSCTGFFCLDYDGKIYPCDRLSDRQDLVFGDLSHQDLADILNSPVRLRYAEQVNSLHPDCAKCRWQKACHNGCTMHRISGVDGKYYYCEARKRVFSYLEEKVEKRLKTQERR